LRAYTRLIVLGYIWIGPTVNRPILKKT